MRDARRRYRLPTGVHASIEQVDVRYRGGADCDRLRSNGAVAPPDGQLVPSCSRSLARASLTSAVAWRTSGLRPSACSTSDVRRASPTLSTMRPRLGCRECGVDGFECAAASVGRDRLDVRARSSALAAVVAIGAGADCGTPGSRLDLPGGRCADRRRAALVR